jgi:transcriptional regulator with GAF, ATPase, and Fis domain
VSGRGVRLTAETFARFAEDLYQQPDLAQTVRRALTFAQDAVAADGAGLMVVQADQRVEVAGATDERAAEADRLQLDCGEGPSLALLTPDTADETTRVDETCADRRWPRWGSEIANLRLASALSVRLGVSGSVIGALTLYAEERAAFDDDAESIGRLLARHTAVGLAVARQEAELWHTVEERKLIGQAQGILMERYGLSAEQAIAMLRGYSQENNVKLREAAVKLVGTRLRRASRLQGGAG